MIEHLALHFTLVLSRVAAFVTVLPLLGGRNLPRTVKVGLSVALTLLWCGPPEGVTGAVAALPGGGWAGYLLAVGREVLVGGLLGWALGLFLVPAQVAGEFLSQEMGLAFGGQVSPAGEGNSGALTHIFEIVAIMIFFAVDGHHAFLAALGATFEQYPVGGMACGASAGRAIGAVGAAQEWGLMLAAPVALCLFVTTAVLALMSRASPQLNLYSVGFPLRLGVGLVALLLLLPGVVAGLVNLLGRCGELAARLV